MKIARYLLSISVLIFISQPSYARFATIEDVDVIVESYNRNIEIHKDGSYVEIIAATFKAIKESGKDQLVSLSHIYNKRNTELKILEAKTILEGVEYPVDPKNIEDKPLASNASGFDQNNQIMIAFPKVELNARVYIKYKNIVKKPAIPGFFSTEMIYGKDQYCEKSEVHVNSEIPFFIKIHDPEQFLDIKQTQAQNHYQLDIVLKKPVLKAPVDESFVALDNKLYPFVTLSTLNEWSELGKRMRGPFETVLNQKIPDLFKKIAEEANTKSTLIEKINIITARLSENITYMGDWRTVKGALIPRDLNEVVKTKFGDCKDFSTATAAILRYLGIKTDICSIQRGINVYDYPQDIPNTFFNHAIVRVQNEKETLWIDPTNFTSYAQGIYPDIAERMVLVFDPSGAILTETSSLNPTYSQISIKKNIHLNPSEADLAHFSGQISLTGTNALPFIGADLRASKETIDRNIIALVANENRTIEWKVDDYNLKSRIAENLNFNFSLTEKHSQIMTTAGKAFVLPSHALVYKLLTKTENRVTDLFLEIPSIYRYETLLSNATLVGTNLSSCSIDSPWIQGSRNITNATDGIHVIDEIVVKKSKILNSELKSSDYATFQNKVYTCFGDTAIVYK